ncbi:MAG: pyridoxamine 5'-phosphate oxidase family protein [Mycobacteriaceae bacterium]
MAEQPSDNQDGRALVELASDTCWSLLRSQEVGRLGVVVRHWPLIIPVNYRLDEQTVVIRSAGVVAEAADHANVTFQIDQVDPLAHTGWSVLVRGLAEVVGENHRPWIAEHTHQTRVEPWAPGDRGQWIRIITQQVTGRRITAGELTPTAGEWGYL